MKNDYEVEVEWLPFELHPEIPAEGMQLPQHLRARFGGMSERLKKMAHESGMEMVIPDVIPNSRRALEASEYARRHGVHEVYHQVVFRKFYGEGQDIHRWDILKAAAEEVGLDAEDMQSETESGRYHAQVSQYISQAKARGISSVPAYIFNNKYAVFGAQPYDVFQDLMNRLGKNLSLDTSKQEEHLLD